MSYNTRRTGGVGRGTGTTQVNYHQQPTRPAAATAAQQPARNVGYTTVQQAPVSYNSAAQPAYTTQPAYSTAPPPTAQPPAQPQPPTPVPKPPATPVTPVMPKQEPVTPQDTPQMDTQENGEEQSKLSYWKKRAGNKSEHPKLSNKVKKARQNAKLRRVLNPKNALTFLNELRPGNVKFVLKEETNWGFSATVDIDGKSFTGMGMSVAKAKIHASEMALKHLMMEQMAKASQPPPASEVKEEDKEGDVEMEEEGGEQKKKKRAPPAEDEVPWGSLAAFALHKLFNEWQTESTDTIIPESFGEMSEEAYYGRRGPEFFPRRYPPGPFPAGPMGRGRGFGPFTRGPPPFGMPRRPPPPAATFLGQQQKPRSANPAKVAEVGQRHPVMVLNQMKPNLVYSEAREGVVPNMFFVITVNVDGKEFVGRGRSKKEAKKNAAVSALATLGVQCDA